MQYIDTLNIISLGDVVLWGCAIGFVVGAILKILEKYRSYKNKYEKNESTITDHEARLQSLNAELIEVSNNINVLSGKIDSFVDIYDQHEARRLRREILKFSDKLREGGTPSKDAFEDIFDNNQEYLNLIDKTGIPNGFTEREMSYVTKRYDEIYGK